VKYDPIEDKTTAPIQGGGYENPNSNQAVGREIRPTKK